MTIAEDPVRVGGITPFTTIDFPGHLAAVIFCQGCPWKCRYCHNSHLQPFDPAACQRNGSVFREKSPLDGGKSWRDVLTFLDARRGFLDGVVFSGGEPTYQKNLAVAMKQIKEMGFEIGLHTAGPDPDLLEAVLKWVDWVGMDIKAPLDARYEKITQIPDCDSKVAESLRRLIRSGIDYQLRTTVHPALLTSDDLNDIHRALSDFGASPTIIQEFRRDGCADPEL